ncbi:efflux RND transporter periplasmic adaptor subunit [Mucilaginibacter rubeus]|uniref:Efflux RND transporter periplasmic adaptor subunit n=1 Tax=Mucilaginibacter rubeus TaxID=2027860 RepID=A0AAE6MGJ8_9SPHI|nr:MULTISPECIES: efflux RND transporter periplasmic adaptor subunit [Sphingobacteriaceae]CDS93181.1 Efflux transporter, RND family, MFP subunit [Sphingobacterium sp. PM2-P1-29]QEM02284.1 efflux RND transporter periplasmic adaptor subunit [Mucilaginibacter rubeus]QEM14910.1 efflux RND transporter periplasmic adaptor subunit [Mucilaginibacter gossypii]QTE42375.1 efflux RND transporter periplasmic adaptor subunit [Mucilaginibacter rubeus]QTE48976.1 efflux RND transporter periplasmic adaptor subun
MYHSISINKKSTTILALTTSMVFLLSACSQKEQKKEQTQKDQAKSVNYKTAPIQVINPEYEISVPAELKPFEQVAVYAKVTGFVKKMYVDRGDRVRKGQLLAVLEAPEMQQQYLSDKSTEQKVYSDYLYAKQAYDRLVTAAKTTGAVADIELDRAKSAMESAKSAFDASKAGTAHSSQLQKYLRLTAPFDGIITQRNVSVGALAGTGGNTPLFMMAQSNKLRLTLSLPEKHASSVYDGMSASFTVSSQPGKTFDAKLSRTSGLLDQHDRSLTLEFDVSNTSSELQGGDYAQVKLKLKRKNSSNWVQSKSVLNTQSGTYVLTLNNNEVKRIAVKEGIRLDTLTEIFGNLSPEDNIILKPSEEIKEGKINK